MKTTLAALALLFALLTAPQAATAQPTERLSRPERPTTDSQADRARKAGMSIVSAYDAAGKGLAAADANRMMITAYTAMMCTQNATYRIVAYGVGETLKDIPAADRKRLKARDQAQLTTVAIRLVAALDGVSPDAIRADEALGPGVYHNAIFGFREGLVACEFYGHKDEL